MKKRKISDVSDSQEKITKYFLRSRIPLKLKEKKVNCKGIDIRKRISSPVAGLSSSENPSSALTPNNANNAEVRVTRKVTGIRKRVSPMGRLRSSENRSSAPELNDDVGVTPKGTGIRKKSLLPVRRSRVSENLSSAPKLNDVDVRVTRKGTNVRKKSASPVGRLISSENPSSAPKLNDVNVRVTRKGTGVRKKSLLPVRRSRGSENLSSAPKLNDVDVRVTRKGTNVRKKSASLVGQLGSSENPSSAPKLNDVDGRVTHKGTGVRKKSLLPVRRLISSENSSSDRKCKGAEVQVTSKGTDMSASPLDRLRSSENPSSSDKLLTEIRTPRSIGALWNRAHILETAAPLCSDPYDFDAFMTACDLKENRQAKRKCSQGKTLPSKKSKNSGFAKPKTVRVVRKKPLNARNVIPLKETSATANPVCVTKSTVVDGELSNVMEMEVERTHFVESSVMVASPESILSGLLEVCVEQKMANKRSEMSISLYQDPDAMLPLAATPFPTKDKPTDQECCTSTPQTVEDVAEPVGRSSISPILKASRPRLQALDLNISGFSAEKNARTYRRESHPKACRVVESAPAPVIQKIKKQKRMKKYELPKLFVKWATSANQEMIEAENFELVIE